MFLGYPDLEYDGFDRTEVLCYLFPLWIQLATLNLFETIFWYIVIIWHLSIVCSLILHVQVLTEKNFNKTVFAEDAKSVVFFNDVEEDDNEQDQYECFLQVYTY